MTSLPGGELPKFRDVLVAGLGSIPRVSTYGEAKEGALVLLEGSTGFMELAVVGGSAAARIELAVGDPVKLSWA